ncbi:hypothetical protein HHI36_013234 [Cryptolaemus montrouzieri]|uniref:Uncharacterized protein n=1 Tax=Cryptolaemus montrouzieri TaxID=559131 RepID=A0ABD2NGJ3_9CUCU
MGDLIQEVSQLSFVEHQTPNSGFAVLRGSRHQGDIRYGTSSHNRQCTAHAAVALAYNHAFPCTNWDGHTVDSILDFGDNLYKKSIAVRRNSNHVYLLVSGMFPNFIMDNFAFFLTLDENLMLFGLVGVKIDPELGNNIVSLQGGFSKPFQSGLNSLFFTAANLSIGVFKVEHYYFIFDSHARNERGMHEDGGVACLLTFENFDLLINFLYASYTNAEFNLFPISIQASQLLANSILPNYETLNVISAPSTSPVDTRTLSRQRIDVDFDLSRKHVARRTTTRVEGTSRATADSAPISHSTGKTVPYAAVIGEP